MTIRMQILPRKDFLCIIKLIFVDEYTAVVERFTGPNVRRIFAVDQRRLPFKNGLDDVFFLLLAISMLRLTIVDKADNFLELILYYHHLLL
jgi:hypothetical protein